jgi:hypothetical protein
MTATAFSPSACSVCKRPRFGSSVPRDATTAAKHPLMLVMNEEHSQGPCEPYDDVEVYLGHWRICMDCRPKVETYLYQAINGVIEGAARAFIAQKSQPKIKRRKR